jgi:hypothetical protein
MNLDQQVQLTEGVKDQNDILMIGGIGIFLPSAHEEAENSVADDTTTVGEKLAMIDKIKLELTMTVKEEGELEQVCETSQTQEETDEKDDEHFEECLSIFSQGAEKQEAVTLELIAEEEEEMEEESENSKEWLDAGASLHAASQPASHVSAHMHSKVEERRNLI